MRRFTLVAGMGEAELLPDAMGEWIPVEDHQLLVDRLEQVAEIWRGEAEISQHVANVLLGLVDNARNRGSKLL